MNNSFCHFDFFHFKYSWLVCGAVTQLKSETNKRNKRRKCRAQRKRKLAMTGIKAFVSQEYLLYTLISVHLYAWLRAN